MATLETLTLIRKALIFFIPLLAKLAIQRVTAIRHAWTWKNRPDAKNVVVVGGSFAGLELVRRLAQTLPTGFRVIWVEKNSHLNFSFVFPRFSVMAGHEHEAFIPYDGVARGAPAGICSRVQDVAVGLTDTHVQLASGEAIEYEYLAIATGSSQPLPVQVAATEREHGSHELRTVQQSIKASQSIAIVGGGAVGVELAGDIKGFYPEKEVTLVHSRGELMSLFGKRLQEYTMKALRDELAVRVLLNERPKMPVAGNMAQDEKLVFSDGREEVFDLIIGCTGQRPNSSLLASHLPGAICPRTARILVQPTLQILPHGYREDSIKIFAFGDVAEHGGPRMARAGWMQSGVVLENMLAMIDGKTPSSEYKQNMFVEGAIKLTLGRTHNVVYAMDSDGSDVLVPERNGRPDLGVGKAWKQFGADFRQAELGLSAKHDYT